MDKSVLGSGTKGLIQNVPINKVKAFENEYLDFLEAKHSDVMASLKSGKYTDENTAVLEKVAKELASKY